MLDQAASGRDLTKTDFFALPDGWIDGRFDVAGKKNLAGLSGELVNCEQDQDEHNQTLELRLANNFSEISMNIGQSDLSEQSGGVLNVQLLGNGKYIDSLRVPFNKIDTLTAPVKDVNALKLEVWLGGENCESNKPIGAVLMDLRVE